MSQTHLPIASRRPWSGLDWALLGLASLVSLLIYFQTRSFQFIIYDDHLYVYTNRHVLAGLSGDGIRWASTAIVAANWHPLTLYTELLLVSVFGHGAGTFHLANTFLHVANTGLLFFFLRYATGRSWPAFFTAILWAWHPLRVESVAWVSELKDVLCGFFFLICLIAYVRYSRRRTVLGYAGIVALHAAALLSKPMAVTLPGVLLLLDWWPLAAENPDARPARWSLATGWGIRLAEKIPLLAMSVADIAYAVNTQIQTGSVGESNAFPPVLRLKNAVVSIVCYLRDGFFPARLGLFHPHPAMVGDTVSWTAATLSLLLLVAITVFVLMRRRQRYLFVGWFWFLGMLTPVIGLIQIGEQARADRYTYLPSIGLTLAVVWCLADFFSGRRWTRVAAAGTAAVAAICLAVVAGWDTSYWRDSGTLFSHAAEVIPKNYLALSIQGEILRSDGHAAEALPIAAEAYRIAPDSIGTQITYGHALADTGHLEQAGAILVQAINKNHRSALAWDQLGDIRDRQANLAAKSGASGLFSLAFKAIEAQDRLKALVNFRQSVLADPEYFMGQFHVADELSVTGELDRAIAMWEAVIAGYPEFGPAHGKLGDAYRVRAEAELTAARFIGAVPLTPGAVAMRDDLAGRSQQDFQFAVRHYAAAYQSGERNHDWETHLAWLTATDPAYTTAQVLSVIPAAEDAVATTQSRDPLALDALADAYARVGQLDAAASTATTARDVALAAKKPALAAQINARLDRYRQGTAYLYGAK